MENKNKGFIADMNTAEINTAEKIAEEKKRQEKNSRHQEKKKKYISITISILIAIGLWLYVVNTENPTQKRQFTDIPVEFLNDNVLEEKGLIMSGTETSVINVQLQGKRSSLLSVKKSDIVASVDISSYSEGDYYVDVEVHAPSSVTVSEINPAQIKVSIESIITEDRDVEVSFEGDVRDSSEAVCTDISTEIVSISGARSQVNKVKKLSAVISVGELTENKKEFTSALIPVDANGNRVDNITVSVSEITVSAQLYTVKTVKLKTETAGTLPDSLELSSIDAPTTIKIAGPADEIEKITEISTQPIDLSEVTASGEVELTPDIPGNVRLASSQSKLTATITVRKRTTQELSYSVDDINLENAEDKSITFASETVSVSITGTESALSSISSSDFTMNIDCTDLQVGASTVTVSVTLSDNAKEAGIEVTEPQVEIEVS